MALRIIFSIIVGYLFGSVSVSVIISKLVYKQDIRKVGSGNAGATNMARINGFKGGITVLVGDFLKAIISCLIAKLIGGDAYAEVCMSLAGCACVLGHAFPVFFNFKGGKGVTVGAAIALMIDWKALLFIFIVFFVVFAFKKIVSISSISGAVSLFVISTVFYMFNILGVGNGYFDNFTIERLFLAFFASFMVVVLHHENIIRLIKGEEKKFAVQKKPQSETAVTKQK